MASRKALYYHDARVFSLKLKIPFFFLFSLMSMRGFRNKVVSFSPRLRKLPGHGLYHEIWTRYNRKDFTCLFSTRKSIAIVGGGLAGLSTAYHLLEKCSSTEITIFDQAPAGAGGASSVAGGLLHPLSPRGKLVHKGLEGLAATGILIGAAAKHQDGDSKVILREDMYRVALSESNVEQFTATASLHSNICSWVDKSDMDPSLGLGEEVLGYLRLFNGCRVIHVPSYLVCLWRACQGNSDSATWRLVRPCEDIFSLVANYDAVVWSAGSGLYRLLSKSHNIPAQLVRGQSLILEAPEAYGEAEAILCGKYVSPLPRKTHIMVGATHEFDEKALGRDCVIADLRKRTLAAVPGAWEGRIEEITEGFRVQSNRGKFGRMPIVGKIGDQLDEKAGRNGWIFTGLSSRGLLYHSLYAEILAEAILVGDETPIQQSAQELLWWKR